MKVLFVISTLLLTQVFAAPAAPTNIVECVENFLHEADQSRVGMVEWVEDVQATMAKLQAQKQRCEDLPRNDPPTLLQDRIIQACETAYDASVAYETARLMNKLQELNPDLEADLREQCFDFMPETQSKKFMRFKM